MQILVAEDDRDHLEMLEMFIRHMGHEPLPVIDGRKAWATWMDRKPPMVVSDWMMPDIGGIELCQRIRGAGHSRYTYFIIVSGMNRPQDVVRGLEGGIDDFITKPVRHDEFEARVEIGERIVGLESELTRRYERIRANYYQTIRMFNQLIETFDNALGGHSRRVAELSLLLAERLPGVKFEDLPELETAALLHDIGMIGLPQEILFKSRTEMTGDEVKLYRSHPVLGEVLLREIEFLAPAADLVRSHHEQYNGRGFPDGLVGDAAPLGARIINAASVFDNLLHRGGFRIGETPDQLRRMRGYQLEPALTDILIAHAGELEAAEARRVDVELPLEELAPGMRLAREVRRPTGALLLPGGSRLDAHGIEKLKKNRELAGVTDRVFVYRDSIRG
ncbi:MAG: HD domain-containing phosphohydrolase [Desulfococcaceae bacterium]